MKAARASSLLFLSLFANVLAMEIPFYEKQSLTDANCENIQIKDNHILTATCTEKDFSMPFTVDASLDLNDCFANYMGTLKLVYQGGGFSSSCDKIGLVNKTKLVADCGKGKENGGGTIHNEYELDNWRVIRLGLSHFNMSCSSTEGIEKKEARPFVA
ncbi:hypothetical protein GGR51DRAFT_572681 [Nemania sp. FL0031]|nr:hypothetical protein GGR51DRAFT_572681 [Nemania sp. FL0031]